MRIYTFTIIKRTIDILLSLLGLTITSPILLSFMFLIWKQDKHSPLYISERVGKDFASFRMVKLRSMIKYADLTGVDSTSDTDSRITPVGQLIRKYKLDELPQLWNVLRGEMSIVGPRANVRRETNLYTFEEKKLLSVKPGITDFASVVFADEGEVLRGQKNPDLAYNQLIRPGKSRLGLYYLDVKSIPVDLAVIFFTVLSIFSRSRALFLTSKLLALLGAPEDLIAIALRNEPLVPTAPPGSDSVITSRDSK